MAAAANHPSAASTTALSPLPLALALKCFSALPVDARARAACVCRGWHSTLEEPSVWTRLDLSPSSGVAVAVTDAVLAGAAAKARGQLAALDVADCDDVTVDALLAVVQANGGALQELRVGALVEQETQTLLNASCVERLLQAAPQLTACDAEVLGNLFLKNTVDDARRMLRNEPPFQPLRLRSLGVDFDTDTGDDDTSVLALAADIASHASLMLVELGSVPLTTPAALNAVVDAALARQLVCVRFYHCRLSPASAPALVRLLGSGALTELFIYQGEALLDGTSAVLFGDALRANNTITHLRINADVWHDANAAALLLGALTGHSSLSTLDLSQNNGLEVQGAALGALVAANAPALTELDVSDSDLNDAALRPLFEALPASTHLRTLNVAGIDMSEAFARDVLLRAAGGAHQHDAAAAACAKLWR
jgi:hypothetical protein